MSQFGDEVEKELSDALASDWYMLEINTRDEDDSPDPQGLTNLVRLLSRQMKVHANVMIKIAHRIE